MGLLHFSLVPRQMSSSGWLTNVSLSLLKCSKAETSNFGRWGRANSCDLNFFHRLPQKYKTTRKLLYFVHFMPYSVSFPLCFFTFLHIKNLILKLDFSFWKDLRIIFCIFGRLSKGTSIFAYKKTRTAAGSTFVVFGFRILSHMDRKLVFIATKCY